MQPSQILRLVLLVLCVKTLEGAPVDDKEERFAVHYLKEYHYLSPLKNGNHNFKDAVRFFQRNFDIPDTGKLDGKTITEMHKPRCGVPDLDDEESSNSGRKKRFAVSGTNWTKSRLTYMFNNFASKGGLTHAQQRSIMKKAFKQWEDISPLSFKDVTRDSLTADITISFFAKKHRPCDKEFDGSGSSLAHAFYPERGVVHFDDDETFTNGTPSGTNFFSVALHEIGHLLGLKHSQHTSAIMHANYRGYDPNMKLTDDEKHGIEYIYDQGTAKPDTSPPSQCVDKYVDCKDHKDRCSDPTLVNFKKICAKTCDQCGDRNLSSGCSDSGPAYFCQAVKKYKNIMCNNKNPYALKKCQKTCNYNCKTG